MIAIIWIASCAAYALGMGLTYGSISQIANERGWDDPEFGAFLMCVIWPLGWLIFGGILLTEVNWHLPNPTEHRHKRELAEAEHRLKVARKLAEENDILDKQLSESRR